VILLGELEAIRFEKKFEERMQEHPAGRCRHEKAPAGRGGTRGERQQEEPQVRPVLRVLTSVNRWDGALPVAAAHGLSVVASRVH
jgi:hypothetical protein